MKRKSIAFDVDDVLACNVAPFVEFSNRNYGTNIGVDDYTDNWSDLWGVDRVEIEKRALQFQTPQITAAFDVMGDSKAAIGRLATKYDLYIVTARPQHLADVSMDWINRHFPGVFQQVHFVPMWNVDNKVTKGDICKEIGADYLVDDLPRHCNVAAESGIESVLFGDYAWNRNEKIADNVTRCKDFNELLGYFGVDTLTS